MPDYTKNFALNLRRFRKKNGLTQKEFAQLLGYSEKTVSKWECEGSIPDIETLFDIARNLQTSLDELFKAQDIYYLGIDGGGTKTDLALVDQGGNAVRTLRAEACNPVDIGFEASKSILKYAIYEICEDIPFSSVCLFAGIAGGSSAGMQSRFHEFFTDFHFLKFANDSDNKNIVAAGLGKRDGVTLIMGTGICAYTQKDNRHTRVSGWGYLIDNGGSGYNLGRDALNAYFCAIDGTGPETALTEEIDAIYPGGAQEIMAYIYHDGKKAVASFAPAVFAALEKQDDIAKGILERNIKEAVHIIKTAAAGFPEGKIPVVLAGGLTKQHCVLEGIKALLNAPDRYELQILTSAPVNGAVMLAKELMKEED